MIAALAARFSTRPALGTFELQSSVGSVRRHGLEVFQRLREIGRVSF